MYKTIEEFKQDWKNESELTIKLLAALTDKSLKQQVYEDGRTLGKIAAHIAGTLAEMMNQTGMQIEPPSFAGNVPNSAKEILDAYTSASAELINQISTKWNDEMLEKPIAMYGETWTYSMVLNVLVRHEIHHRAQMTILMRQAGLVVPGVYGPSKEEWVAYGMPVQD